jgi:hypothetical protein
MPECERMPENKKRNNRHHSKKDQDQKPLPVVEFTF